MKHTKTVAVRCAAFCAIFALLFGLMARALSHYPDYRCYQLVAGFYEEAEGSLDAVYVGSSNCYAFWNAPAAWHNYGLAVYPFASPSQPFYATEHLMREARKTQPDAMFIVNVNSVDEDDMSAASIHYLVNYMPDSENKAALIDYLADLLGYNAIDRLEFRFPWLRIRELWLSLIEDGPLPPLDGLKGASTYGNYLSGEEDISGGYDMPPDWTPELPEALEAAIVSLLDYCDETGVRVLFVSVPRVEDSGYSRGRIERACDMIRDRGYEVLDMSPLAAGMGLDLTRDYYNTKHANLHGSLKFTRYLSEYLIRHYGLKDRRGSDGYASWDQAWARYSSLAAPWMLDIEADMANRDYALPAPAGMTATDNGAVRWDAVAGADGCAVYRKVGETGAWTRLGDAEGDAFEDAAAPEGARYTVVPWREKNGEIYYGNFDYSGVGVE